MADARDHLRAADADRQAVADRLRVALDEGRLDFHEYDTRLRDAYAARTYGELSRLIADLPGTVAPERSAVASFATADPAAPAAPTPPAGSAAPAGSTRDVTLRWLLATWDDYFGAVSICVAIWLAIALAEDDTQGFWPIWVAGPWGAYLAFTTVKGLATGEPQRWAARRQRKRALRHERRALRHGRDREDSDAAEV
jgi:hypothetical protein